MMMRIIVIYKQFDIVTVPFPFTDSSDSKKRPAIIISSAEKFNSESRHSIMAMITSARNESWPCDISISNLTQAGLPKPSIIRMKFFTLDHRFILNVLGSLDLKDRNNVKKVLKNILEI